MEILKTYHKGSPIENFMHIIFLDRLWFVYIPFVSMLKFQSLAH